MITLNGTEKQVAWANDIRTGFVKLFNKDSAWTLDAWRGYLKAEEDGVAEGGADAAECAVAAERLRIQIATLESMISDLPAALAVRDSAEWWINNRKDLTDMAGIVKAFHE